MEDCRNDTFDIVVNLNKNRVLGRLGSQYFKTPAHHRGIPRGPLWMRLERLLKSSVHSGDSDIALLHRQKEAFHTACLHVESSKASMDSIKCAIKSAYELTEDGYSLARRLQNAKVPFHVMDKKEVRDVNKLAN